MKSAASNIEHRRHQSTCRMLLYDHRKRTAVWIHYTLLELQLLNLLDTTKPNQMILVSFFSEDNALSDKINIYYIFEFQSNENRAFRFFFGTPGIASGHWNGYCITIVKKWLHPVFRSVSLKIIILFKTPTHGISDTFDYLTDTWIFSLVLMMCSSSPVRGINLTREK